MAIPLINTNLTPTTQQLAILQKARNEIGIHHYFQDQGYQKGPDNVFAIAAQTIFKTGTSYTAAIDHLSNTGPFKLSLLGEHKEENYVKYTYPEIENGKQVVKIRARTTGARAEYFIEPSKKLVLKGTRVISVVLKPGNMDEIFCDGEMLLKEAVSHVENLATVTIGTEDTRLLEFHYHTSHLRHLIFEATSYTPPLPPKMNPGSYVSIRAKPVSHSTSTIEMMSWDPSLKDRLEVPLKSATDPQRELIAIIKAYNNHVTFWSNVGDHGTVQHPFLRGFYVHFANTTVEDVTYVSFPE